MEQQIEIALGVGARSEKGRREDNQDKMTSFSTPLGLFYIVADGMGGHRGGAEASHIVVEGYRKHLQVFPEGTDFADVLQHATTLTNAEIYAAGRSGDPAVAGMGSTVVLAMLRPLPGGAAGTGTSGMEVLTAHIGDSRAYLLRSGILTQLTHDHSAVQRMVDEQLITAEAAKTHPDLNVLTRAIGKQAEIAIEVGQRVALYPGDTILLCTDGLWGHVSDEQMSYELSVDRSASDTTDVLVQLALDNGSDDNVTLQILRLEDRNAPGRPLAAPMAAAASGATLLDLQRGRGGTQGYASPPVVTDAAPVVRVDVGRSSKRKNHFLPYALLVVACVCLGLGGLFFASKFRKTKGKQAQPAALNDKNCGHPGSHNDGSCPDNTPPKVSPQGHGPGSTPSGPSSPSQQKQDLEKSRVARGIQENAN